MDSQPNTATPPQALGDFEIVGQLGAGASGVIYEARWGPRTVALKVLRSELVTSARDRQRFVEEARLLAEIAHPGVVKVLGMGTLDDDRPYLVMEKLDGQSLAQLLRGGPMPLVRALGIFADVAGAVEALHASRLLHRDVKPENVFIVDDGGHAVLLDVGIARPVEVSRTEEGVVVGTPAYMAPERLFGAPASIASDVYELGLLLFAMLTGSPPWQGQGDLDQRMAEVRLADRLADVPEEIDRALGRAMAARAADRPASVAELTELVGVRLDVEDPGSPEAAHAEQPSTDAPAPPIWSQRARSSIEGMPTVKWDADASTGPTEDAVSMPGPVAASPSAETRPGVLRSPPAAGPVRRRVGRWAAVAAVLVVGVGSVVWLWTSSRAGRRLQLDLPVMLRTLCDRGNADRCAELGRRYAQGDGVMADAELSAAMYLRACEDSQGRIGCAELAMALAERPNPDMTRVADLLDRGCRAGGAAAACAELARRLQSGDGVDVDHKRAVELGELACERGEMASCVDTGYAYGTGRGVAEDVGRAAELYRRACDGGDLTGCFNLGYVTRHGRGVDSDPVRAVELYRRACDGGVGASCANLGKLHSEGAGVQRDLLRAAALYQRGCDLGAPVACGNLGVLYEEGRGVVADPDRAVVLYEHACKSSGGLYGCNNLGNMTLTAEGAGDAALAVELYRKACSAGVPEGCENLADMLEEGRGAATDPTAARSARLRACELRGQVGCGVPVPDGPAP